MSICSSPISNPAWHTRPQPPIMHRAQGDRAWSRHGCCVSLVRCQVHRALAARTTPLHHHLAIPWPATTWIATCELQLLFVPTDSSSAPFPSLPVSPVSPPSAHHRPCTTMSSKKFSTQKLRCTLAIEKHIVRSSKNNRWLQQNLLVSPSPITQAQDA